MNTEAERMTEKEKAAIILNEAVSNGGLVMSHRYLTLSRDQALEFARTTTFSFQTICEIFTVKGCC